MSYHFPYGQTTLTAEPFPHAEWKNAVNPAFYAELSATFPLDQFADVLAADNQVHRLSSEQLLENPSTKACWRDFIRHLTSQTFWQEVVELFGSDLRSHYRHLEQRLGRQLEDWRASRRGEAGGDIVLEALVVINTPVRTKPSHVKCPHIDTSDKLWTGLLYMRGEDDHTPGGGLHLHRPKGPLVFDRHQIPRTMTEVAKTIPYEANRFIGFVNRPEAIHSVGVRPVTPHIRKYVDLVVELPRDKAFDVPQMGRLQRAAYRLSGQRERTR